MLKFIFFLIGILSIHNLYCQSSFTDNRDKKVYPVQNIDGTIWMKSNLKFNPNYSSFYYLGADEVYYSSKQVIDGSVCPDGWRIPTLEEWKAAEEYIDDLMSRNGWVNGGQFKDNGVVGAYWTSTLDSVGKSNYLVKLEQSDVISFELAPDTHANCKCIKE
ncbi:MAG: FISUMP domain-containing protein [Marinoscillum sp.]